jgi:hypothetical protein
MREPAGQNGHLGEKYFLSRGEGDKIDNQQRPADL